MHCRRLASKLCVPFWSLNLPDGSEPSTRIPCPSIHPETRTAQGRTWTDEYSYLESGGTSLAQHLQAESAYYKASMRGTLALQQQLQKSMLDQHPASVVSTGQSPSSCF